MRVSLPSCTARSVFSPFSTRNALASWLTRTLMPSASKRSATMREISGSSRFRMRGSISTWVTCEPRRAKALRELRADRPAAQDDQPLRQLPQLPHRVGGEVADLLDAGYGGHVGPGARRDDDGARGERPRSRRPTPRRPTTVM